MLERTGESQPQERGARGEAGALAHRLAPLRAPLYTTALNLWLAAAGTALAGFVFWTVVARLYDAHDVGLGSAALSAMALLATFSHLGLGLGLIRFLPEAGKDGPRLANVVFTASAVGGAVSSLIFLAGLPLWAPSLSFLREEPLYAAAFVLFVAMATVSGVQLNAFTAIRRARYLLAKTLGMQAVRLALPAAMALFFGAFGIIAAGGISLALGALFGFLLLMRGLPGYRPAPVLDLPTVVRIFPFSSANYAAEVLLLAPGLVLPLLVVRMLGPDEGAYFYMAWFLGYLLTSASAYLALSLFAEGSHDPGSLLALSRNAVVAGLAVSAAGALFFLLLGDKVLLVFGGQYSAQGAALLRVVALAALPAAVVNVYLGALRVTKQVGELVAIAGVVAVTTLALSYLLLPSLGLVGVGVAHGLGQSLALAIVLSRLLAISQGTVGQRVRWLLVTLTGRL